MRTSNCCNAPIKIHPYNKQKQCSKCGRIQAIKTKVQEHIAEVSEKVEVDELIASINKPVRDKPPRVYTEAQKFWIRKKEDQRKAERLKQLRNERYKILNANYIEPC